MDSAGSGPVAGQHREMKEGRERWRRKEGAGEGASAQAPRWWRGSECTGSKVVERACVGLVDQSWVLILAHSEESQGPLSVSPGLCGIASSPPGTKAE